MKKYKELDKLPDNIINTDKQYKCVICGDRVKTYNTDIDEYICSKECTEILTKFKNAVEVS